MRNTDMDDKVLVRIPNTKFNILGAKQTNGKWNLGIINRYGAYKRTIDDNVSEVRFRLLINYVLNDPPNNKKPPKAKDLINLYKKLIQPVDKIK